MPLLQTQVETRVRVSTIIFYGLGILKRCILIWRWHFFESSIAAHIIIIPAAVIHFLRAGLEATGYEHFRASKFTWVSADACLWVVFGRRGTAPEVAAATGIPTEIPTATVKA